MLIGFIKHNRSVSIIVLPLVLVIVWMRGFIHPVIPFTDHAAPLYNLIISVLEPVPYLSLIFSFILIFFETLLINYVIEKNEIIETKTYLPALVYILLMSLQSEMLSLNPILVANLFMIFALHKLMQTYRKETAYASVFDAGTFVALASLFYFPSVILGSG